MDKIYDVTAMGEMLIDFTKNGESEQGNGLFEACPGGAPCNVLAMLNKLGRKTAFIGKVGNDQFGRLLKDTIDAIGIETKGLILDEEIKTTLAFVHTFPDGDREFSFYRKPGADMMLEEKEVDEELIRGSKVFHFGTLSMTDEPVRTATKKALETAKEAGCLITFDPNLRPPLWKSLDEAKEMMEYGFTQCDVLKISDNFPDNGKRRKPCILQRYACRKSGLSGESDRDNRSGGYILRMCDQWCVKIWNR